MKVNEFDLSVGVQPFGPMATPVPIINDPMPFNTPTLMADVCESISNDMTSYGNEVKFKSLEYKTHPVDQSSDVELERQHSIDHNINSEGGSTHSLISPEFLNLLSNSFFVGADVGEDGLNQQFGKNSDRGWTDDDLKMALDELRSNNMSLTKVSLAFGIPSSTLWSRANQVGIINTFRKKRPKKTWSDETMNTALRALGAGTISANRACKLYGIPTSTLYRNAQQRGVHIKHSDATSWSHEQMVHALYAIRSGQMTVRRAADYYGIPSGTLYGRCRREKIKLVNKDFAKVRRSSGPWTENDMIKGMDAVCFGLMTLSQAALHYNLPYSTLYMRFKRMECKEKRMDDDSDDMISQGQTE